MKIFSHDSTGGVFFERKRDDVLLKNPGNPDAKLFSILKDMENYRDGDGKFHFKLCYPPHKMNVNGQWMNGDSHVGMDGICNEWTQTSNPITEGTITGYQEIHLDFPHKGNQQPWGGLGRTNMNDTNAFPSLIDDTGTDGFWWMAIGASSNHQHKDTFPGPFWHNVNKVDFYVKLERGRTGRGGIHVPYHIEILIFDPFLYLSWCI